MRNVFIFLLDKLSFIPVVLIACFSAWGAIELSIASVPTDDPPMHVLGLVVANAVVAGSLLIVGPTVMLMRAIVMRLYKGPLPSCKLFKRLLALTCALLALYYVVSWLYFIHSTNLTNLFG